MKKRLTKYLLLILLLSVPGCFLCFVNSVGYLITLVIIYSLVGGVLGACIIDLIDKN